MQRLTGTTPRNERLPQQQQQAPPPEVQPSQTVRVQQQPAARPQRGGNAPRGENFNTDAAAAVPAEGSAPAAATPQIAAVNRAGNTGQQGRNQGGRGGGQQSVAGALRGRVRMADFAAVHPKDLLAKISDIDVRELEWTSFAGTPIFSANLAGGQSQLVSLEGTPISGFDQQRVIDIVKGALPDPSKAEIKVIDQYDLYYFDRTRQRPLPVLLVLTHDEDQTRYYVDPKSARVLTTYSSRNWVNRYLYTGLHSLNFPFLYNYRPLWDIVVITFMVGGTALCVTSLVLTWRVLGRKLRRIPMPGDVLKAESGS
jgi:hypothetical protein